MNGLIEMLNQYIRAELIAIIPVLTVISKLLYKSKINDGYVQFITFGVSVVLCGLYVFATQVTNSLPTVLMALFTTLTQGILLDGASVYTSMIVKALPKKETCNCDCSCNCNTNSKNEDANE